MRLRTILFALLLSTLPLAVSAQDLATLRADRVSLAGDSVLIAEGEVVVSYRGQTLRATRIVFDRENDHLSIEGPITVTDGHGNFVMADAAELSTDLTEGVLKSARLVMNEQMQIAATQMFRLGGRYTQLSNTVASSCQVCSTNPTPLWEIRAKRVVHDQQERQLYFDGAQLRFAGVPVFYIPRLRMPDPTLDRATGFLMTRVRTTSALGTGIKQPYFIRMGDSRDLTLTPYLTTKGARTFETRYRQAFATGAIQIDGAISSDDLLPGEQRGYVIAQGAFDLPRDFVLSFRAEAVTDPAYYLDYGISDDDRLDSRLEISRARRNEYISGRLVNFRSIRETGSGPESNAVLPTIIGDFTWHRRFSGGPLGGEAGLRFQTHSHYRSSTDPLDSDGDGHADGRDVARSSLRLDWRRNWIMGPGILGAAMGEVQGDLYHIQQDALFGGATGRLHGAAAVELRWPWVGTTGDGASHVIEPVAQLVLSPKYDSRIPNEDSALTEFDESNLFSLNRFAGSDAREQGAHLNLGLGWTRYSATGWSLGVAVGRVIRTEDLGQFSLASGLDGTSSDWLAAMRLNLPDDLALTSRLLIDDNLEVTKAELRLDMERERYGLSSSYVWLRADSTENRLSDTSELYLDGRYNLTDNWRGKVSSRYDFVAERATRAGLGLEFRNECLLVDLSLSRRFTTSTSVKPTTDFGLSVDLLGFGGRAEAGPARRCRG